MAAAAAATLLFLFLALRADATALSTPAGGPSPTCRCHDVDPRTDFFVPFREGKDLTCLLSRMRERERERETTTRTTTTASLTSSPLQPPTKNPTNNNSDQAQKGGCGQAFMKSAIAEVGEYCQISCGSCDCCAPLLRVAAERAGGGEFAFAYNASLPWLRQDRAPLTVPGFMATVLVPPDAAMASVIARLGGRGAIERGGEPQAALTAIVAAHIVKPNSEYNALWTSPFLRRAGGQTLATFAEGVGLQVKTEEDGVVFAPVLSGGGEGAASARMAARDSGRLDLEACKGAVIGVDHVILPYPLP